MGAWVSCEIHAGPYSWSYVPAESGAPTGVLGDVLDGLTVSTNYDENHPLHGIPQPSTATFRLLVAGFADVADLEIGAPVSILVRNSEDLQYDTAATWGRDYFDRAPLVHWLGRISDLDAVPTTRKERLPVDPWGDPGPPIDAPRLEVTVTCVDYMADLNEITVGAGAWPAEPLYARFDRLWHTDGKLPLIGYNYWWGDAAAREAGSPTQLLEIAQQTAMSNWATEHTYVIVPYPESFYWDPDGFVPVTVDTATDYWGPGNPLNLSPGDYVWIRATRLPGADNTGSLPPDYPEAFGVVESVDPVLGIKLRDPTPGDPAWNMTYSGVDVEMVQYATGIYLGDRLNPDQPYRIHRIYKRDLKGGLALGLDKPTGLPLVLALGEAGWLPTVAPLGPLDTVIPAAGCLLDTTWRKSKEGAGITKVTVTNADGDSYSLHYITGSAPVEYAFEAVTTNPVVNQVWKLLPESSDTKAWNTEEITILDAPDQVEIPWFDSYRQAFWYTARSPVVISGVSAAQNPNGTDWVAGMFINGTFTLTGGQWQIKAQLRPDVARSRVLDGEFPWYTASGGALLYPTAADDPYLTARGLAGTELADVVCSDFDPRATAYALRLVRRPD